MNRASLGVGSVVGALACLAWAAWLALDWVDYGLDSTCGNFIRRGGGEYCSQVRQERGAWFVVLIIVAVFLFKFAARSFRNPSEAA